MLKPVTVNQYVVLAEYNVVEEGEMAVKVGDVVSVQKVGKEGWWLVSRPDTGQQGWVPGGYLEPLTNQLARSSPSLSSQGLLLHCGV